jgi:hypothetical protein
VSNADWWGVQTNEGRNEVEIGGSSSTGNGKVCCCSEALSQKTADANELDGHRERDLLL